MKLILVDKNAAIVDAWNKEFTKERYSNITAFHEDFRNLPELMQLPQWKDEIGVDKLVMSSAGNSYGVMGGGIDLAIAQYFPGVESQVRTIIEDTFYGEIHIGQALFVALDSILHPPFHALIYCPTMRAPIRLYSHENVYLATRAALMTFMRLQSTFIVAFEDAALVMPGFGGQCGALEPARVAYAMRMAYDSIFKWEMPTTTLEMRTRHKDILHHD